MEPSYTGKKLSHYEILEEISRGGMGFVYRALDVKLKREVALKVLPPDLVADPERRQRFVQEAQAAAALKHPHIAVIHEIDEADGLTFIAMELVEGEKLSELLRRERLTPRRAVELATEIAEGLARAHEKWVVHRDLKPANVMLTEEGHAKIIDFGLAKLVEPLAGAGSEAATALRAETAPGVVMGTLSYMSPEQARGGSVDHRSDIFSLGIVLFEMLTGELPFRGQSALDTLSAILRDPAPRLSERAPAAGTQGDVQRLLDKCLAKDPDERYPTMKEAVTELRAVLQRIDTGAVSPVPERATAPSRWKTRTVLAVVATLGVALAALVVWRERTARPPLASSSRPSVAVLYFENNTGDPGLDWLRTALTDMLVTDLSQSPRIQVLTTDRLYQILRDMNRLDERITSFDLVQQVAAKGNVGTVLLGSFVKAGENIRISVRLQDVSSGRVLTSDKVEGVGESSIFPMVDDLTRRIKAQLDVPEVETTFDREVRDVTTSSVEAYRDYLEGMKLHWALKEEEAIPLFEKAVELDPNFAMALARLGTLYNNLGDSRASETYAKRALEHLDRLSERERYYIEGRYYHGREESFDRAIAAYSKGIELYPDLDSARHNLAVIYTQLERYDEVKAHLEELVRRPDAFEDSYATLASSFAARGDFEPGERVLRDFLRQKPDSSYGYWSLGLHLVDAGDLDQAVKAFEKSEQLRPGVAWHTFGWWNALALKGDWSRAEKLARTAAAARDSLSRWVGSLYLGVQRLYQGRSEEALRFLETSADAHEEPGELSAWTRVYAADVLLQRGDAEASRKLAERGQREGRGSYPEWYGLSVAALARAQAGGMDEAMKTAQLLREKTAPIPSQKETRRYHHLLGELALLRGDARAAVDELEQAAAMLPPRGLSSGVPPFHVPVWFSLASARLAIGEDEKAEEMFRRIVESPAERVFWPIHYARSLYFLGEIYERRGERANARESYKRFSGLWKDGDLDLERVRQARAKAARL